MAPRPSAQDLLRLQATAGDQAVGRMLQRRVIRVYKRDPKDQAAAAKDRREVDQMVQDDALAPHAGAVEDNDLAAGGSLADIKVPELIVVSGHGNVGRLNGYSGSDVASMLTKGWRLPPAYAGTLRLTSCKAGDDGVGFLRRRDPNLVETVSSNLVGYAVTVEGMKGNVVVGGAGSAAEGIPRSTQSDQAFNEYKRLQAEWRALQQKRYLELNSARRPSAVTSPTRSASRWGCSTWTSSGRARKLRLTRGSTGRSRP